MTLIQMEGFETIGDDTTDTSVVKDAALLRFDLGWTFSSNGPGGDLIDDFEADGAFALRTPAEPSIRTHYNMIPDPFIQPSSSIDPIVTGFRIHLPDSFNSNAQVFSVRRISDLVNLQVTADCTGLIWTDETGAVNLPGTVSPNTWHYIEVEAIYWDDPLIAYVKIWVDDTLVYDSGGRNIARDFSNEIRKFRLSGWDGTSNTGSDFQAFDDFYAIYLDGTRHTQKLGAVRIRRHEVTADGSTTDWTPSTGTDNFATVDEVTVDKVDFVESSTAGDIDLYALRNSYAGIGEADGLKLEVQAEEEVESSQQLYAGVTDGTVDETGKDVDTADTFIEHIADSEPSSGDPLSNTILDGLQVRLKWGP